MKSQSIGKKLFDKELQQRVEYAILKVVVLFVLLLFFQLCLTWQCWISVVGHDVSGWHKSVS